MTSFDKIARIVSFFVASQLIAHGRGLHFEGLVVTGLCLALLLYDLGNLRHDLLHLRQMRREHLTRMAELHDLYHNSRYVEIPPPDFIPASWRPQFEAVEQDLNSLGYQLFLYFHNAPYSATLGLKSFSAVYLPPDRVTSIAVYYSLKEDGALDDVLISCETEYPGDRRVTTSGHPGALADMLSCHEDGRSTPPWANLKPIPWGSPAAYLASMQGIRDQAEAVAPQSSALPVGGIAEGG